MYFSWLEYHPDKVKVEGSNPSMNTIWKVILNGDRVRLLSEMYL